MKTCKVCNSTEIVNADLGDWEIENKVFTYSRCKSCDFVFCDPTPSEALIHELYSKVYPYEWFSKREKLKKIQAGHRYHKIKYLLKNKNAKILDYGAGHGFFLEKLKSRGYDAFGYDPEIPTDKNNYYSSVDAIPNEYFDLITLWHTFEHISNTTEVLEVLLTKLSKGGKIVIVLPNSSSLGLKVMQRKWVWLQEPYFHVNHFNKNNLSILLRNSGYKTIKATALDTWDAQLYDLSGQRFLNLLKRISGQRGQEWFVAEEGLRLIFTIPTYICNPILNYLNTGSELTLVASKV